LVSDEAIPYRISAIPLGGYVKMSGENPMEEATGDPGEFMSHPRWHTAFSSRSQGRS